MCFGNNLKKYRQENGLTQEELAKKINTSRSNIANYENGKNMPSIDTLEKLSKVFNCSIEYLLGKSNKKNPELLDKLFSIPILNKITTEQSILADENIEGYLLTDPNIYHLTNPDNYFYLHILEKSMDKIVKNGSYVLVQKQDYAQNGDIIVAIVNGNPETTLKKYVKINDDLIVLESQSNDCSYESIYINKDINFKIIGKAIGYWGKF